MAHSEGNVDVCHALYAAQQPQELASCGEFAECGSPCLFMLAVPASDCCSLASDVVCLPMQACPVSVLPLQTGGGCLMEYQPQLVAAWAAQPYPMVWPTQPHPAGSGDLGWLEQNRMAGSTHEQPSQPCGPCNVNPQSDNALHAQSLGFKQSAPTCIKRLMADLRAGGDVHRGALAALREPGAVRELSFKKEGCRLVQLALDLVDRRVAAELALDLRGSVVDAVLSPYANHVIQKILAVLNPREAPFVVVEISEASRDLACHEYGCRVYCRLLEQAAGDAATSQLVDELLYEIDDLAQHEYGHHVIECAFEHGLMHQRSWIICALRHNLWQYAWNRYGAYVLDKAFHYCDQEQREALSWDLLAWRSDYLAALAASQYGSPIVRTLMDMPEIFVHALGLSFRHPAARARLMKSKFGKRLCADLDAIFVA